MSDSFIYDISDHIVSKAHINEIQYTEMYQRSVSDPNRFWAEQAECFLDWFRKWDTVCDFNFAKGHIRWFEGAKLNVTYNCLDRHLEKRGNQLALVWESDDGSIVRRITYRELFEEVCRLSNVLRSRGIKKGDRICIYMPMIPESIVAMLSCARIGAIHSVVFGGFSPKALRERILDSDCQVVITADEGPRGGKNVPLKANADEAMLSCSNIHTCIVVQRTGCKVDMDGGRDIWYHEALAGSSPDCVAEEMDAEDPLYILYTSGSTGKPKGVVHTTAGYLLYVTMTFRYSFDYKDGEIYWCAADIGWVTGHSYIVYGPLSNGAVNFMFEGVPVYPDASRFWEICDRYNINILYTAPTVIRALIGAGDKYLNSTSRKSLRVLGTVGEPINPEAWQWYHEKIGHSQCPIIDTWWQTETGGHMITPLPGVTKLKPGSATRPFFGVVPSLVDSDGNELEGVAEGALCINRTWPGQMRTVWGDHDRFIQTYFRTFEGKYMTGDGARRDKDGYYWITGRVDDVMNVSGHRLGTAEIESALVLHSTVAEAAVVGFPHDIKGEGIYAYVTTISGTKKDGKLHRELFDLVCKEISPIAKPDVIQFVSKLPKTRSGKILRRILRKVASNNIDDLGDTSTLAEPDVVDDIIANRVNIKNPACNTIWPLPPDDKTIIE